jgi:phage shock protein A
MGLFDRMGRAASANFNALLARLEDPKKEIALTIREMEEQVRLGRQEIVQAVASEKQARKKADELASEAERWEKRAELAVRHGDDALAREALRQKKRLDGERDRAEALRAEHRGFALEQKSELERMERTVTDVKSKQGLLAARLGQARSGAAGVEGLGARPGGDAFAEFRRMEDQIEAVETTIAAEREVSQALAPAPGPTGMAREDVEARFRALEANAAAESPADSVDDELRALKSRLRVDPG